MQQLRKTRTGSRHRETIYLGGPGKHPLISVQWTRDHDNNVVHYGLAYIDFALFAQDNGRVLGYDNGHQVHERHFKGQTQVVNFVSYEATAKRFFDEVRLLRKGELHG